MLDQPTCSVPEAARALGVSRQYAYALIERGAFPVPIIRVGSRNRVPTGPLRALLGIDTKEE